jgi:hypothetical protein
VGLGGHAIVRAEMVAADSHTVPGYPNEDKTLSKHKDYVDSTNTQSTGDTEGSNYLQH